jgi:hypothetical protein
MSDHQDCRVKPPPPAEFPPQYQAPVESLLTRRPLRSWNALILITNELRGESKSAATSDSPRT